MLWPINWIFPRTFVAVGQAPSRGNPAPASVDGNLRLHIHSGRWSRGLIINYCYIKINNKVFNSINSVCPKMTYVCHHRRHTYVMRQEIRMSCGTTYVCHKPRHTYVVKGNIRMSSELDNYTVYQRDQYLALALAPVNAMMSALFYA